MFVEYRCGCIFSLNPSRGGIVRRCPGEKASMSLTGRVVPQSPEDIKKHEKGVKVVRRYPANGWLVAGAIQ